MEAMSISERVERLERLHGIAVPAICPDPTGEGSAWQGSPIPANEGGSQKAGLSGEIAESVVQDLQQACYDRDELRATVERLTSELDTTKRLLAESLVERDRLKSLHDARKVRIDGFRDVLSEHLGDLR